MQNRLFLLMLLHGNVIISMWRPPLHKRVLNNQLIEIAQKLIRREQDSPMPPVVTTPLSQAVTKGEVETVKLLIKEGSDVNALTGQSSPLYIALTPEILQWYSDPEVGKDTDKEKIAEDIIQVLLEEGADVSQLPALTKAQQDRLQKVQGRIEEKQRESEKAILESKKILPEAIGNLIGQFTYPLQQHNK